MQYGERGLEQERGAGMHNSNSASRTRSETRLTFPPHSNGTFLLRRYGSLHLQVTFYPHVLKGEMRQCKDEQLALKPGACEF
jgi:hypothetical protein